MAMERAAIELSMDEALMATGRTAIELSTDEALMSATTESALETVAREKRHRLGSGRFRSMQHSARAQRQYLQLQTGQRGLLRIDGRKDAS